MNRTLGAVLVAALLALPGAGLASAGSGQAGAGGGANAAAQANNPLANFTAFNVHEYYIGKLTEPDENGNQVWLRFAEPFEIAKTSWLLRASLPINTYPTGASLSHTTGLGDLNAFAAYLIDVGNPAISLGVGPQLTVPTATKDALGSGKWSAGLVNVLFDARSHRIQYGYLLSWQASFAGDADRDGVNLGTFQPFVFYQLGGGTYLRSTGIWAYDFEHDAYTLPLGLGVGQVIPTHGVVLNVFVEPQVSVVDAGAGWAKWQVFAGVNTQF